MAWLAQQPHFSRANAFTISTSLAVFGTTQLSSAPPAGDGPDVPPLLCLPAPGVHGLRFHGRRMWIKRDVESCEAPPPPRSHSPKSVKGGSGWGICEGGVRGPPDSVWPPTKASHIASRRKGSSYFLPSPARIDARSARPRQVAGAAAGCHAGGARRARCGAAAGGGGARPLPGRLRIRPQPPVLFDYGASFLLQPQQGERR